MDKETWKWNPDASKTFTVEHVQDAIWYDRDQAVKNRLQTAYALRQLLANVLGLVRAPKNWQAMIAPPVNWTDNGSLAARVAHSTNIGKGPENVSLKQPTKTWTVKKPQVPWKKI